MSVPPNGRSNRTCASMIIVRTARSAVKIALLFESDPVCALFDFAAFLRFQHLLGHPVKFLKHDGFSAHSCHERKDQRAFWTLIKSRGSLGVQRAATAHAAESHVGFDDANYFEFAEGL